MDKDLVTNSHLLPLNVNDDVHQESDSDVSSINSDIEVDDAEQVNDDFIRLNLSNNEYSSEDEIENSITGNNSEEIICLNQSSTSPKSKTLVVVTQHKRRQWSFQEKLKIISEFNKGTSLHTLELKYKCIRKMIRHWKKNENQLVKVLKDKGCKGKKRKRLGGAGAKLAYYDLDEHLFNWYRSKRGLDQEGINVCKDKVTFKGMIRQGKRICAENKSKEPSIKWYTRFLKRHRLSLQKPVRRQKISLPEAYLLIEKFHSFLRRSGRLGPERSVMGCFIESDVCNMDESPLNLWGDQSKRCIDDINTKNEIDGHLDDKRFATLILCVFPEGNHRVEPVLLFKGTGRVAATEEKNYSPGVKVFFTPKSVINTPTMEKYMTWWFNKVKDGSRKLFITDSCTSHLNENLKKRMRDNGVCLAIIPKGCTQYIQILDVYVFSAFKNHYYDFAEEFLELNGPRSKLKLTSSQKRVLCTRLTSSAWARTLKSINFQSAFRSLGYTWTNNSIIQPSHIKWYKFDPNAIESIEIENDSQNNDLEKQQETTSSIMKTQHKQLTLKDIWKK
ncbi:unnamed protein product [Rotaria socialis]|uniref:DDE-1 domain-containing protein n=1 Tax=Rotaria socialis TaxID=392032 RepID=A0A820VSU1_9BILA|nr:unnamed protein product [Rotaria socialis]CAF4504455.1 unnamed protein product [Rotaria socialis]